MNPVVKPDTRIKDIEVTDDSVIAHLMDGRTISVPLVWSWRLMEATSKQRKHYEIIWDGGPSHTSAATTSFLRSRYGSWLRVLSTPAHSSWLNQAEILLKSFEVRYLQRGNWTSRQHLIDHLYDSTPEYNRLWAQPINWSWTRRDLHNWAEKKST
ncbi:MAG TPA: DUF2442 domain-containing protein [Anaerolineales bacterium]|nr:DUF2442 domain-containing protein [Anaerolineales bacterium]